MALCVISSTKISVVLHMKWSINRSWKEKKVLCCVWKSGWECVIPGTIIWLGIRRRTSSVWFWCPHVCRGLLLFSDCFDLLCKGKDIGSWVPGSLSCLEKDSMSPGLHPAWGPVARELAVPTDCPPSLAYFWVGKASTRSCLRKAPRQHFSNFGHPWATPRICAGCLYLLCQHWLSILLQNRLGLFGGGNS